jgi:hypothetical protein
MLDVNGVQELDACVIGWIRLIVEGRLKDLASELVG